ncbi:hypothetical protein IAI10_16410 [Clostridium sp. 19966]|uniref:type IA DNA topoisomerase n=1 Tax=Clostridium sp. 19966 TaxID=2768166 RepID=UPI0028DE314E|nr:DNA topoisomerase [Clostridium sp. 19966]MDT8718251.1 hypothetical protein [Clostridium sp. 19966]
MGIIDLMKKNKSNVKFKRIIISEKKMVGQAIAAALNCSQTADGHIEGDDYVITWCNGNMFTLKDPEDYDSIYRNWDFATLPFIPEFQVRLRYDLKKKKQFEYIKELLKRSDIKDIILATDSGREGQLLGNYLLEQLNTDKTIYRLWTSSLTKAAIKAAMTDLKANKEYDGIYNSAKARNELDQLIGVNFSRAYSLHNKFTIAVGRCIIPILNLICERDKEIQEFKADLYSEVVATFDKGYSGTYVRSDGISKLKKEDALNIKNAVDGKVGEIKDINRESKKLAHPLLFNLTELQRVCSRKYDYTPKETVILLEELYLNHKIVSYPRTASQFITDKEAEEIRDIFKMLQFDKFNESANYCLGIKKINLKNVVNNDLVEDHPAITPVLNENTKDIYMTLREKEKNIFDEIVLRYLSVFYEEYIYESIKVITEVGESKFISNLTRIISLGWKKVYGVRSDEEGEYKLVTNEKVQVIDAVVKDKKTKARPQYTADTLLEIMENPRRLVGEEYLKQALKGRGIGTEATRADLIESLIEKGYVTKDENSLMATELGKKVISCIDIDLLKSVELTADLEYNIEKMSKGLINKDEFMKAATKFIIDGVSHIKNMEPIKETKKKVTTYGKCFKCNSGRVVKVKGGYGCTRYKDGCKLFIPENISGTYITEEQMKKLASNGQTDFLQFKGADGPYRARIAYNKSKEKTEFKYR